MSWEQELDSTLMRRILIAFLGNTNYTETIYRINGKDYKSKLAFKPIHQHFSPIETTYILGTKESRWDLLKDFAHEHIEIPYGKNEADFWEMFDILVNKIDLKDSEVIFDITHGFRAIPLFTSIYIRLLKQVEPSASLTYLFYGSFEKEQSVTPIVDLSSTLELLDWIDATNVFVKYGELNDLSAKMRGVHNKIWKQDSPEKPIKIGMFSKKLEKLSNILSLTYTPLLAHETKELSDLLQDQGFKEELTKHVKPLDLLSNRLISYTSRFSRRSLWESHLEVAKWYLENKRLTQALLVLREVIVTYLCEASEQDPYDYNTREHIKDDLNDNRKRSRDPIYRLWSRIIELRNRVGHAFMRKVGDEMSLPRIVRKVENLIGDAETALAKREPRGEANR